MLTQPTADTHQHPAAEPPHGVGIMRPGVWIRIRRVPRPLDFRGPLTHQGELGSRRRAARVLHPLPHLRRLARRVIDQLLPGTQRFSSPVTQRGKTAPTTAVTPVVVPVVVPVPVPVPVPVVVIGRAPATAAAAVTVVLVYGVPRVALVVVVRHRGGGELRGEGGTCRSRR